MLFSKQPFNHEHRAYHLQIRQIAPSTPPSPPSKPSDQRSSTAVSAPPPGPAYQRTKKPSLPYPCSCSSNPKVRHNPPLSTCPKPSLASLLTSTLDSGLITRNHGSHQYDDPRRLDPLLPRPYCYRLVGRCLLSLLGHQGHKDLASEAGC